jgi:hypothetical protein
MGEPMDSDEYRDCLDALRWGTADITRATGVSETTAKRWANGRAPVPPAVADWLRRLCAAVERAYGDNPAPRAPDR